MVVTVVRTWEPDPPQGVEALEWLLLTSVPVITEADAWARIRSQQTRSERLADTDYVLDNSGSPEQLDDEVEKAWLWILSLPNSP